MARAAKDPLFERVLAEPGDAGLRSVWADALIERGDPRGELISLQVLAGDKPTPAQDKRMRSLISKHRVEWLAELADVLQHREGLVFDRGVLAAGQVQIKSLAALQTAIGHPLWATLRSIWFCDRFAWDPRIVPLLVHPVMRSLREVTCVGFHGVFAALARHDRPLPFTSIWTMEDRTRVAQTHHLTDTPGLPALRRLGFTIQGDDESLLELRVVRRIETLGLTTYVPAGTWLARTLRLSNLTTLELRRWWIPIQGPLRSHYILRFTRGPGGEWSQLDIERAGRADPLMLDSDFASIPMQSLVRITADAELHDALLRRFANAELIVTPGSVPIAPAETSQSTRTKPKRTAKRKVRRR